MKLLVIIVLIGFTHALQPNVEYLYEYYGQVDTGMPDISTSAMASVAIRANIRVVVKENGHALFKTEKPVFGQYHGDLGCDARADIPYEFVELSDPDIQRQLTSVYEANLYGTEDVAHQLSEKDPLWLSNIRKAITSLFRNKLLGVNFEDNKQSCPLLEAIADGITPETFTVVEETIFGRCNMDYTVHKIPDFIDIPYLNPLEKLELDEQQPSSTLPDLNNTLWHVTRTIDFDNCQLNFYMKVSISMQLFATPIELF